MAPRVVDKWGRGLFLCVESPAGFPFGPVGQAWVMAVPKLITGRGKETPMIGLIQSWLPTRAGIHWLIPVLTGPLLRWGCLWRLYSWIKLGEYTSRKESVVQLAHGVMWNWNQEVGIIHAVEKPGDQLLSFLPVGKPHTHVWWPPLCSLPGWYGIKIQQFMLVCSVLQADCPELANIFSIQTTAF